MGTQMLQRRGPAADWISLNYVLGDGELGIEEETGFHKVGDGVTGWNSLPYQTTKVLYTTAGDILVATAAKTPARLAKGANGQYLTMVAGAVAWATPPVPVLLDGSATMTGDLSINKGNAAVLLTETGTDRLQIMADTAAQYIQVDDELHVTAIGGTISSPKTLRAGALYDTGNRVYSLSNPPPGAAAVPVPGYNCFTWPLGSTDMLPVIDGTIYNGSGMTRFVTQVAVATSSATPAGVAGVPRWGFDATAPGNVTLEGLIIRSSSTATMNLVGLAVNAMNGLNSPCKQFVGFALDGSNGNVKAFSYSGTAVDVGSIVGTNGTQRGSTVSAVATVSSAIPFKILVTAAGVVTFTLNGSVVYTGSLSIPLTDFSANSMMCLIANQNSTGVNTQNGFGHFIIHYA